MFTAFAKNTMLDNWGVSHLSLHTAYSTSGANEPVGGSPAYSRQSVSFAAASGGSKAASNQPIFQVPGGGTIIPWVGKWIGATFAGMETLNGAEKEFFVVTTTSVFTTYAHGYTNGVQVAIYGDTMPGGLTEGTLYYVRDATTDTFKLEATLGGGAITISSVPGPACVVSKCSPETFSVQGTLTITAASYNLNA